MYALVDGRYINVPGLELNRALAYEDNAAIQGFTVKSATDSVKALALIHAAATVEPGARPPRKVHWTDLDDPQAVHRALATCDELGRTNFLETHGYELSRDYFIRHDGKLYDSKPIYSLAFGNQFPDHGPLSGSSELSMVRAFAVGT